jgi:hypothetical protein
MALWPAAHERPHLQVGYMAAPTSRCKRLKESLANGEPSIHGPFSALPAFAVKSGIRPRHVRENRWRYHSTTSVCLPTCRPSAQSDHPGSCGHGRRGGGTDPNDFGDARLFDDTAYFHFRSKRQERRPDGPACARNRGIYNRHSAFEGPGREYYAAAAAFNA